MMDILQSGGLSTCLWFVSLSHKNIKYRTYENTPYSAFYPTDHFDDDVRFLAASSKYITSCNMILCLNVLTIHVGELDGVNTG